MGIRWPRILTPTHLSQIISTPKNPLTALQIFNQAHQKYPNYRHNGPVYATMINILGNSGRILEMKQVIDQMKDDSCECKDSVFVGAIRTFASAGMVNEALNLFNCIPQFNCVNFTESFNTILGIVLKESNFKAAYQLFSDNCWRLEVKSRVKSLNLLMEGLCRFKKSDLALNSFQEMDFQGCYPDRESYRILMKGLCDDGRLDEAIHLLYSMFWRISQKGSGEDIVIYRILLDALCDDGKVEEALEILGKVLRKGLKAPKSRRQRLDLSQCRDREDSEATKRLINEALIRGGVPSMDSYSAMAIDLYNEGRVDEGNKVLNEMHKRGFFPSLPMYEAKAEALSKKGRVSEVIKVIEEDIKEGTCVPSVGLYNTILKCLCNAGDSELAIGYLKKTSKQVGCVATKETYSILVNGLFKEGKYVEASRVLEEMLIKSHRPGAETYNGLIKGLCLIGRQYEAVMWLEEMVSQGMLPDLSIWNSLVASVCCKMSDIEMFSMNSF
ncbi:pentatricopeptide repeat-containing protein At1g05600-like [Hibiscus syriacus]|uniref:pentatricopeptide repeat-containing protein At1g05600-like n=1 Tax=Hibiscus syriacus TaxID=106335 RepID=UPI0019217851|nr:pentatricopeptide repeat-containing protein At1g05600-like [Hibiscus syriacus]